MTSGFGRGKTDDFLGEGSTGVEVTTGCSVLVLTSRSGGGDDDDDVGFKAGAGVSECTIEADVEGAGFVEGVSRLLVAASTSVLCDGLFAFIDGVVEGRVDDGSILEDRTDVVSTLVLCEGSLALNE